MTTLRLGTRGSALALAQARLVREALLAAHPGLRVETREIVTHGDRTQHTNFPAEQWGQGVFVKEIERALLADEIDLAVHSLKDLPPGTTEGLALVAIPRRLDPRDGLVTVGGSSFDSLPSGARVGTSSARRVAFLRALRPELAYVPIRGNVDTRLKKLRAGEYDAIVLALAGLERLGLDVPLEPFEPATLLPAPGQGALAMQARGDDARVGELAAALHHRPTALAVQAERAVMEALDGGCRLPVAALGVLLDDERGLSLRGAVAAPDGSTVLRAEEAGSLEDAEALARRVVEKLRARGAEGLLVRTAAVD